MKCLNCGGNIPYDSGRCPYCGISASQSLKARAEADKRKENRFVQLDKIFGLETDFMVMPTDSLEKFLEEIESKFKEYQNECRLTEEQIEKIDAHISSVEEELQNRYPLRENLRSCKIDGNSVVSQIENLLEIFNPPDVYSAAYNIRASIERCIIDKYKYRPVKRKPGKRSRGSFYNKLGKELTYQEVFFEIIGNKKIARSCAKVRSKLHLFVHQCKENDTKIDRSFPSIEDKVNFIRNTLELFNDHLLI